MTISDRIFERLSRIAMTQKEFAELTGIKQSTISEWKKKRTNPSSDKILAICRVLEVSPEWLLSGSDSVAGTGEENGHYVINIQTRTGQMVERFNKLDKSQMDRVLGYLEALSHESDGVH